MSTSDLFVINNGWESLASSNAVIQRGIASNNCGNVGSITVLRIDKGFMLNTKVKSSSGSKRYDVEIVVNARGGISDYKCSCPAYQEYNSLCKHCAAAILAYNTYLVGSYRQSALNRNEENTSESGYIIKNRYEREQERRIRAENERRAKIAVRRSRNVLNKYKDIVTGEIELLENRNRDLRNVTLIPIIDTDNINRGVYLCFQIRKKSDHEIASEDNEEYSRDEDYRKAEGDGSVALAGLPRPYVIKNIRDFMASISLKRYLNFGKELSFVAYNDAFDETSNRWIAFLKYRYESCAYVTDRYRYSSKDRYIKLTSQALNDMFDKFKNCLFRRGESGTEYIYALSDEQPHIKMTLSQNADGAITISCDRMKDIYTGVEIDGWLYGESLFSDESVDRYESALRNSSMGAGYIYVVCSDKLCRFSETASKELFHFIIALIDADGKLEFHASQRDELFSNLLPDVSKYIDIDDPSGLMKESASDVMTGRVLLDAPDRDNVTAVLLAGYRGIWLNPLSDDVAQERYESDNALALDVSKGDDNDASKDIKRDYRAEQRFLVNASYILGCDKDKIMSLISGSAARKAKTGSSEMKLAISGDEEIFSLLTDGIAKLQKLGEVLVTDKVRKLSLDPPKRVSVGVTLNSGLLKLNIDAGGFPIDEMRELINAYREKKKYFRLKDGGFIKFNRESRDAFDSIEEFGDIEQGLQLDGDDFVNGEATVPAFRAMYLDGIFNESRSIGSNRDKAFCDLTARVRSFANSDYALPKSLEGVMRNYQKTGYRWMRCLESCSFCGILADDMGLGKSVQFISVLLAYCENYGDKALPSLIVCPSSLVLNWKKEIEKFAPSLKTRIIQGVSSSREALIEDVAPGEIVITSYDLLKRDVDFYNDARFEYFAIDEAQYIKNHTTQAAKAVKKINCKKRFALTGTPIENRLSELWSIFDFLMPGYLYRYARFKKQFEIPIAKNNDETASANLKKMIMPFVLRRLKSEVLTELPPKTTTVVYVEMNEKQLEAYNAMLLTGLQALKSDEKRPEGVQKMQVLALLTKLRRLCCDPSLCFEKFNYESSKLEACMELLCQAKEGGHKVLLFSQYTDMLDILEDRVKQSEMSFLRLQGSTPVKDRMSLVETFNKGETDVFLISLKAGGTGLNLTAADTVIHYDPWWNIAAQDQATDRAHRIGQSKNVQVYKLIAQNTIEERILKLQQMKQELANIVNGDDGDGGLMEMSADEIVELIRNR